MQPNYQTRDTEQGIRYSGESLPLGPHMARQAELDRANRFYSIMNRHASYKRRKRISFYSELTVLLSLLVVLNVIVILLLRKKNR